MSTLRAFLRFEPTPEVLRRWGGLVIGGAFGFGLFLTAYLTWSAPEALPYFVVLPVGAAAAWWLFRRPLVNLCVVLLGFALIADFEEGIQPTEALYGLYFLAFLGHWLVMRLLREEPLTFTREDRAFLFFLIWMTASIPLTFLFGGSLSSLISEWYALLMLALYFPIREACMRYPHGLKTILLTLLGVGLLISVRNLVNYQAILVQAAQPWEVTRGRIYTNDGLLMTSSVMALVFMLLARHAKQRLPLLGVFLLFFGSLLLTQSRTYWVTFAVGAFIVFIFIDRRDKGRLLAFGMAGGMGLTLLAFIILGDYFVLVLSGLFDRLLSLQSAATRDVSLINRFLESAAVWEHIKRNPIIGHGMGVKYSFFDITYELTRAKTFVHNGYFSLWFRFGLIGLGAWLFTWAAMAWRGIQAFLTRSAPMLARTAGLATAACLAAFSLSALAANPFFLNDTTFLFGALFGIAGGAYQRARAARPPASAAV